MPRRSARACACAGASSERRARTVYALLFLPRRRMESLESYPALSPSRITLRVNMQEHRTPKLNDDVVNLRLPKHP